MFQKLTCLILALLLSTLGVARSQQAISSITQSRLFTNPTAPGTTYVDANGTALPEDENAAGAGDDSFGTQLILKNQERRRIFTVFADASVAGHEDFALEAAGQLGELGRRAGVEAQLIADDERCSNHS